MKLTPGEIYFIGERDHITGLQTSFFKIGIVRADDKRTSEDRLSEHQTGNPRPLFIHQIAKTEVVERIETLLHRQFAQNRVVGEWFNFEELKLEEAIQACKELAQEAAEHSPLFADAARLSKEHSNDTIIPANDEAREWFDRLLLAELTVKRLKAVDTKIRDTMREAILAGESVGGVARERKKTMKEAFNQKRFKEEQAELYAKYEEINKSFGGRFLLKRPKDLSAFEEKLSDKVMPIVQEIENDIIRAVAGEIPKSNLGNWHLIILENIGMAEWEEEVAEARLRVLVGTNQGIEGICTWKRQDSEKKVFNQELFRDENFDMYKTYVELTEVGGGLLMEAGQAAADTAIND